MKISSKQYAQTLFELTVGKSADEIDRVVVQFFNKLKDNGHLKLLEAIIKKFVAIYNKENAIVQVQVITKSGIDQTTREQVEKFIKKKYQAKEAVLENIIDENIKGGIIIKTENEIWDGSVARKLRELKKAMR